MGEWLSNPGSVTVVGLLLVAIITGSRGDWVFKKQLSDLIETYERRLAEQRDYYENQMKEIRAGSSDRLDETRIDRDEWKDMALRATNLGKRVVDVAEKRVS